MGDAADEESLFQFAIHLDDEGRTAEAISILQPLVETKDNPRYLMAYALCLQQSDRPKEAIEAIECALAIEPRYCEGDMRLFLADLLLSVGRKIEAIEHWKVVAKMAPNGDPYGSVPYEAIAMLEKYDV